MDGQPSPQIDACVCSLLDKINNFSDAFFDADWVGLTEEELEELVVKLINYWTSEMNGELLAELLLQIRHNSLAQSLSQVDLNPVHARTTP